MIILSGLQSACKHEPVFTDDSPIFFQGCGEVDTLEENSIPRNQDTIYFQNDAFPILLTRCAIGGCHDPVTARGGVIMCSYELLMTTADIVPYDTHEGELLENVTSTDPDHRMPPSPYEPLSSNEIDIILQWVQQGALNNKCLE